MPAMNGSRPDDGPTHQSDGSWATENLPLTVRKELLQRDLKKLGQRHSAGAGGASHHHDPKQQDSHGDHPQAETPDTDHPG
jgi:hypothetical protein